MRADEVAEGFYGFRLFLVGRRRGVQAAQVVGGRAGRLGDPALSSRFVDRVRDGAGPVVTSRAVVIHEVLVGDLEVGPVGALEALLTEHEHHDAHLGLGGERRHLERHHRRGASERHAEGRDLTHLALGLQPQREELHAGVSVLRDVRLHR